MKRDGFDVGEQVNVGELYPAMRAKLALANLMEMIGLIDMFISQPSHEIAREGWEEKMEEIFDWCFHRSSEIGEWGSALDTMVPFIHPDELTDE